MVKQYEIYWGDFNPTKGSEVKKIRPCVILSPDEMNKHLKTIIVAPITSKLKEYKSRTIVTVKDKKGSVMIDQIRTFDKVRIKQKICDLTYSEILEIKKIINELLVK